MLFLPFLPCFSASSFLCSHDFGFFLSFFLSSASYLFHSFLLLHFFLIPFTNYCLSSHPSLSFREPNWLNTSYRVSPKVTELALTYIPSNKINSTNIDWLSNWDQWYGSLCLTPENAGDNVPTRLCLSATDNPVKMYQRTVSRCRLKNAYTTNN